MFVCVIDEFQQTLLKVGGLLHWVCQRQFASEVGILVEWEE